MKRCLACVLTWIALAALAAAPVSAQDTMGLWIDPDGSTYIKNLSATETFSIQGYSIESEALDLINTDYDGSKGWKAFEDIITQFPEDVPLVTSQLGHAALSMGSAAGSPGGVYELTLNLTGLEFSSGEQWFLGKPFSVNPFGPTGLPLSNYKFQFLIAGTNEQTLGVIVPEPSTLMLATLAGLGLVTVSVRSKR